MDLVIGGVVLCLVTLVCVQVCRGEYRQKETEKTTFASSAESMPRERERRSRLEEESSSETGVIDGSLGVSSVIMRGTLRW